MLMKKKVGIIVAEEEEFEAIVQIMDDTDEKKINELTFLTGKIIENKCVLVKGGVGKVNAARVTQLMIDNFPIEYIINVGVAGALDPMLEIGDVVIAETLVQHDFDITAFGHTKGYITGIGDRINADKELLIRIKESIKHLEDKNYNVETGVIASGDIFCTDIAMKNKIYTKFDAKCVEMEGAAIAQVCYLDNIPFLVIRSISDTPNGENAMVYEKFIKLASKRCANILRQFFILQKNYKKPLV